MASSRPQPHTHLSPRGAETTAHRRRSINVCARCHKRKRKCDRTFPTCSGCAQAGVECTGLNPTTNGDAPRSIVQFLEQTIAQVEGEKTSLKLERPSTYHGPVGEVAAYRPTASAYKRAASVALESGLASPTPIIDEFAGIPYRDTMLLTTGLPLTISDLKIKDETPSHHHVQETVKMPFNVAKTLFEVYVEKILPQSPFFMEDDLRAHFDAVYSAGTPPTDVSTFIISMVLAVSTMTSRAYDFHKVASLTESLHRDALKHCDFLAHPSIRSVQGLLLLLQLAELLPYTGNLWHLAGEAVSLTLELGLHQDPMNTDELDFMTCDIRRRIFWSVYCMERSTTVTSHRRFTLKDEHINVSFPTEYEDSHLTQDGVIPGGRRTKLQFLNYIRFRQIQSEIFAVQFFDRSIGSWTYASWAMDVEKRLREWQKGALAESEMGPDWFVHAAWQCYLMLHRPCPRNPNPTEQSMMTCIESAIGLSAATWEILQSGYLQYPFHNAHNGFEATTVVLYGLKNHARMIHERYGDKQIISLIGQLSGLFDTLAERWPVAATIGEFLHTHKKCIMETFLSAPSGIPHIHDPDNPDAQLDHIVLHKVLGTSPSLSSMPLPNAASQELASFETQFSLFPAPSDPFSNYSRQVSMAFSQGFEDVGSMWPVPAENEFFQPLDFDPSSQEIDQYYEEQDIKPVLPQSMSPTMQPVKMGLDLEILRNTASLLPSCNRCRARRIKCERTNIECQNCATSGSVCVYYDKLLSRDIPCSYIEDLQQNLLALLDKKDDPDYAVTATPSGFSTHQISDVGNNFSVHVRTCFPSGNFLTYGLQPMKQVYTHHADTIFFGSTSCVTRLAELRELPSHQPKRSNRPGSTHQDFKDLSANLLRADIGLPPESTAASLLRLFNSSINVLYRVIDPSDLDNLCASSQSNGHNLNFLSRQTLNMILAISLQLLSKGDPSLAVSSMAYFRAATGETDRLRAVLKNRSLRALRMSLLICIYVLLRPQCGDIWRLIGFTSRICNELAFIPRVDKREMEEFRVLSQTLHCIECNLAISLGRPSQLPDSASYLINNSNSYPFLPQASQLGTYLHAISCIKSRLHDTLMSTFTDRDTTIRETKRILDTCNTQLASWLASWEAEIGPIGGSPALRQQQQQQQNNSSPTQSLRVWGNLFYFETLLFLQRHSTVPLASDERLNAIHRFLQCCTDLHAEGSSCISHFLADPNTVMGNLYPGTWLFAHGVLAAAVDLVKLREQNVRGPSEVLFRSCMGLLRKLEEDRHLLVAGFGDVLENGVGVRP